MKKRLVSQTNFRMVLNENAFAELKKKNRDTFTPAIIEKVTIFNESEYRNQEFDHHPFLYRGR